MQLASTVTDEKRPPTAKLGGGVTRTRYLATVFAACLFTWTAAGGPEVLVPIGILINAFTLAFGEPEEHFPMLITWGLTSDVMVIGERSIFGILLVLLIVRIVAASNRRRTPLGAGVMISCLVLIACQFAGETVNGAPMFRATEIALMLLLSVTVWVLFDWALVDYSRAKATFVLSTVLVICGSLAAAGGDITTYLHATDNVTRLGEDARVLGGAMGIPIYVLGTTTLLLTPFIRRNGARPVGSLLLGLALLSVGLLTVSRVLIIGIVVVVVAALGFAMIRGRFGVVAALFVVSAGSLWSLTEGPLRPITERYVARNTEAGLLSGRDGIYSAAFETLNGDPLWFLSGNGAMGYVLNAEESGSLLSYSAHNLYLDIVLSWGVAGLSALAVILWLGGRRLLTQVHLKLDGPSSLTAIAVGACFMSGGSLWYFSTYVFVLVSLSLGVVVGRFQAAESRVS